MARGPPPAPTPFFSGADTTPFTDTHIRRIAIVGGGTAGWIAAAMLMRALQGSGCQIAVIEAPDIPTVGVGEATIPPILDLLRFLGIDAADFIQHTQATFKLGIRFLDWRRVGHAYWHPFGTFGAPINQRPFYHAWHKAAAAGTVLNVEDFSVCAALARAEAFRLAGEGPSAGIRYALHFDAIRVAEYLRQYAMRLGCERIEARVIGAQLRPDGCIEQLTLSERPSHAAELFIDCTGFRGLLIEDVLHSGYLDWREWLPCDRALAFPTAPRPGRPPYTQAAAMSAGWRWRIPLQHRNGNGYVFDSRELSDEAALRELSAALAETPLAAPRVLRFTPGRRRSAWIKNCVALGLASGFLEPLESTSIQLIISGVHKLFENFPGPGIEPRLIDNYNRDIAQETEAIRDFLILHYCLSERDDSPFWRAWRSRPLPESLQERLELYRQSGRIRVKPGELFSDLSWFYVFEGMELRPERHDPLIDVVDLRRLNTMLGRLAQETREALAGAKPHDDFFEPTRA